MLNHIRYITFLIAFGLILSIFSRCIPANYGTSFNPFELASTNIGGEEGDDEDGESDNDNDNDDDNDDDDDDTEDTDESGDEEIEGVINEEQIPYNMMMDTMAFISCDPDNVSFKFRMASTYEGGIKLKDFLRDKTEREIKEYPYYRAEPFLGFTQSSSPEHISTWSSGSLDFSGGKDFNFPSTVQSYLGQLIDDGGFLKTKDELRGRSGGEEYISVSFKKYYPGLFDLQLLLGFRYRKNPLFYETQDEDLYIHGRYYEVDIDTDSNDREHISEVFEINPQDDNEVSWDCSRDILFEIRRHPDNVPSTELEKENFQQEFGDFEDEYICPLNPKDPGNILLQNMLGNQWNVNVAERCVSPKSRGRQNSCYPRKVARVGTIDDCRPGTIANDCPHFISICFRDLNKLLNYLNR